MGKFIKSGIILLPSCHLTRDFNLNLRQVRRPLVKSYSLQETVSILTLSPCRQKYDCHGDAEQSASQSQIFQTIWICPSHSAPRILLFLIAAMGLHLL